MKHIKAFTMVEAMIIITIIGLFLMLPISWLVQSHFEAKSYNNITGQHVSTWDAMWVELRVQAGPANNTGEK